MKQAFALLAGFAIIGSLVPAAAHGQINFLDQSDCAQLGLPCSGGQETVQRAVPINGLVLGLIPVLGTGKSLEERIDYFTLAAIYILFTVAVIYLVYAGFKYISSQGEYEAAETAKRQIIFAGLGLIIAMSAFVLRNAVIQTYQGGVVSAAADIRLIAHPYIELARYLLSTAATVYLIYAGYKYINSRGDAESTDAAKRQIAYSLIGLVVAAGAQMITSVFIDLQGDLIGQPGGPSPGGAGALTDLVVPVINAVLVLVAIAAMAYMIMAGVMYFASQGDEQRAEAAKQQLIYAIVGILVILLSAAIVNFFYVAVVT